MPVLVLLTALLTAGGPLRAAELHTLKQTDIDYKVRGRKITQIFGDLEKLTGYNFFYNTEVVENVPDVTMDVTDGTIGSILDEMSRQTGLDFKIVDNTISVSRSKVSVTRGQPESPGIMVTGTVTDPKGNPVVGATVSVRDAFTGTITDKEGRYGITIPGKGSVLVFSFIGYGSREVTVSEETVVDMILEDDLVEIEQIAVVGYGTQRKGNITGSIATMSGSEMSASPVASVSNALAGRLPGLMALQSSGQPGSDAATLKIRGFGNNALVIVDGVEMNFNTLDVSQIESISILKDGSASIYGARAGNGVILVTTKRGQNQKPTITLNSSYTMQGITTMPKPANAGQYAEMEREKWINAGNDPGLAPYTEEQVRKYYDGTDSQYPDTDWFDLLTRKWSPQQQHNASIRGGSDKITYYGFFGYMDQQSFWKKNGGDYNRYNLQSNIDAKITDNLSLQIDIAAIFDESVFSVRGSQAGDNSIWQDLWNTLPIYPSELPDPTKIPYANGMGVGGVHISSNYDLFGYRKWNNQNMRGTVSLKYDVKRVEGLSAKFFANYMCNYSKTKNFNKPVEFYTYDYDSEIYTLQGATGNAAQLSVNQFQNSLLTTQLSIAYDRMLASDHHVSALVLFEGMDHKSESLSASREDFLSPSIEELFGGNLETAKNNGYAVEMGRISWVGRFNYAYRNKYLLETTLRADASAKFPKESRWGYFPGVSLDGEYPRRVL